MKPLSLMVSLIFTGLLATGQGEPQHEVDTAGWRMPTDKPQRLANGDIRLGQVTLHRQERCLRFTAWLTAAGNPGIENLITTSGGREHETLFSTDASPLHVHTLLLLLGGRTMNDGKPSTIHIDVEWRDAAGTLWRDPVESFLIDTRTGLNPQRCGFAFTGSALRDGCYIAEVSRDLATVYNVGAPTLGWRDPGADNDIMLRYNERRAQPFLKSSVHIILTISQESSP